MCGPLGIGFLYGKLEILQQMPPEMEGAKMNANVFRDHLDYADIRYEFEVGTPAIADAIRFGAATDYLTEIGMDKIYAEELEISRYLFQKLQQILQIRIYGPTPEVATKGRLAISIFTPGEIHANNLCKFM
jgi:cysteine desulfurase/selenocysteine lyase